MNELQETVNEAFIKYFGRTPLTERLRGFYGGLDRWLQLSPFVHAARCNPNIDVMIGAA